MSTALESYINRTVAIVTSDGRMIVGTLKGFDQTINLILDESHERVFSSSQGVEQVVLGLYIVRGDNVAVIGEIDEETDSTLDLGNIRAEPLNSVVHWPLTPLLSLQGERWRRDPVVLQEPVCSRRFTELSGSAETDDK